MGDGQECGSCRKSRRDCNCHKKYRIYVTREYHNGVIQMTSDFVGTELEVNDLIHYYQLRSYKAISVYCKWDDIYTISQHIRPTNMNNLIEENRKNVEQLVAELNRIKQIWQEKEKFFIDQRAFKSVQIETEDGILAFKKYNHVWKLVTTVKGNWVPVVDSPSIQRVRLLAHVDKLFEELVRSNKEVLDSIKKAIKCGPVQP